MQTASFPTEAIKQALAQGAIPEAYQADPQQVIDALHRLRVRTTTPAMGLGTLACCVVGWEEKV